MRQMHGSVAVEVFVEPTFQQNGMLVCVDGGTDAWIIDPGFSPQPEQLVARLGKLQRRLAAILLTHCHVDHIAGIETVRRALPDVPIWAPEGELEMLADPWLNLSAPIGVPITAPAADRGISVGGVLQLDGSAWRAIDVAGHSPAGLAYYCEAAGVAIVGDSLFSGSIGRYDFPGSSGVRLIQNIRRNLLSLPGETVIYPGHGPSSTIGEERESNPYLQPGFQP